MNLAGVRPGILTPTQAAGLRRGGKPYPNWVTARLIAFYGDSLTDNSSYAAAGTRYTWAEGWPHWAQALSGYAFDIAARADGQTDFGWSGYSALGLTSGADFDEVVASVSDTVFVLAGTNDTTLSDGATTAARIAALWDALIAAGKQVIGSTLPPRYDDETANGNITAANALLPALARARQVPLFTMPALVPGDFVTDTNVHFSQDGAHKVGAALATFIQRFAVGGFAFPAADDAAWLTENSDGVTDWTWASANSHSHTVEAVTDGDGVDWWEYVITKAPADYTASTISIEAALETPPVGVNVAAFAQVEILTGSDFKNVRLELTYDGSTTIARGLYTSGSLAILDPLPAWPGIVRTPDQPFPADGTSATATLVIYGTGTIRVRRLGVMRAPALTGALYPGVTLTAPLAGTWRLGTAASTGATLALGVDDIGSSVSFRAFGRPVASGTVWHPKDVSGVELVLLANVGALDAGDVEAIPDDEVRKWVSQTATAHLVTAASGKGPLRKSAYVNGNDALLFNGVDQLMTVAAAAAKFKDCGYGYIMAACSDTDLATAATHTIFSAQGAGYVNRLVFASRTAASAKTTAVSRQTDSPPTVTATSNDTSPSGWHVLGVAAKWKGQALQTRLDGVAQETYDVAYAAAQNSANTDPSLAATIGAAQGPAGFFPGPIAGIITYASATDIDSDDLLLLEKYLGMLIGVTIS